MSRYDHDDFGNRMKQYEQAGFSRAYIQPGESFLVRLDGRAFSKFTKNFKKPYDPIMSRAMERVMTALTKEFNAAVGYTQSDEITLAFITRIDQQVIFGGRVQKLISLLAARASVLFNIEMWNAAPHYIREGHEPVFDARIIPVPHQIEAYNCILWRQQDATKNAISMAAHNKFSQSVLHGKTGPEMQEMLFKEHGINFNDYPPFFKRGIFARRFVSTETISEETLARMPAEVAERERGRLVVRHEVKTFDCWIGQAGDTLEDKWYAVFGGEYAFI